MILSIKKKEEIISNIKESFKTALSAVIASLHGVTANAVNKLRKESRDLGVHIQVIPNSLLKRAVFKTSYVSLSKFFSGQNILVLSTKNPSDAAQICIKFSKEHENFKIKGAVFEGKSISLDKIDLLSNLPNYKEESILRLISLLQVISIGNLISVLRTLSNRKVKL